MSAEPTGAETAITALARVIPDQLDDAIQILDARGLGKLALFAGGIAALVEEARALTAKALESDAQAARAAELLGQGGIALKELDALRRSCVDPLNEQVKGINKLFHVVTDPAEALCGKRGPLETVLLAYRDQKAARLRREREEAERKQREAAEREAAALAKADAAKSEKARQAALAEAEAASRAQAQAAVEVPREMTRGLRTDSGLISERTRYVLQGFTNLDEVPLAYWRHEKVIAALSAVVQAAITAGARAIPGCSIGEERGLTKRPGL